MCVSVGGQELVRVSMCLWVFVGLFCAYLWVYQWVFEGASASMRASVGTGVESKKSKR